MAVWLVFTPAILRALGADGFAVWSLFYALTGYLASLDFGFVQGTLRHVASARERGRHEEAGAFTLLGVLGFIALGALWLIVVLFATEPLLAWLRIPASVMGSARLALLAGAGVFTLAGVANVCLAALQSYGRFDRANAVLLAMTAVQAISFAIALATGGGFAGLVAGVASAWALGVVLGAALLSRAQPGFRWGSPRAALAHAREAIRFGAPMQYTSALASLNVHLDKVLIPRWLALAVVAPYELGSRVVTVASSLPQLMLLAVLPEAAAMHAAGDQQRLRELYDRGQRFLLTGVTLVIGPLVGVAGRLFEAWLGAGHQDAVLVLRVLALSAWISLATGMGTTVARAAGRTDLEAWFATLAVGLHAGLSLRLLPAIGLPGAVVASVIGVAVGALVFSIQLARVMRWSLGAVLRPCVAPALATLAAAAAGAGLDRSLPSAHGAFAWVALGLCTAASAIIGTAALAVTGGLPWRETIALVRGRLDSDGATS